MKKEEMMKIVELHTDATGDVNVQQMVFDLLDIKDDHKESRKTSNYKEELKKFMDDQWNGMLTNEQMLEFAHKWFMGGRVLRDLTNGVYRDIETDALICKIEG